MDGKIFNYSNLTLYVSINEKEKALSFNVRFLWEC